MKLPPELQSHIERIALLESQLEAERASLREVVKRLASVAGVSIAWTDTAPLASRDSEVQPTIDQRPSLVEIPKAQAVVRVVEDGWGAVTADMVRDRLADAGVEMRIEHVRSTLSRAVKIEALTKAGRGLYCAKETATVDGEDAK